ncbi:response regulator [Geovibrio thiophilus]|uniref:histidine kinase n=1 Tax=Geovibrio thiophilus TaxID=139438 RepID=A0A3R5XYN6_9BACT|nr:FIST N-terminal domain-containing protein [Geovibrio thiophilus]QAR33963.1 response regulator [Geovibrio thiophilus]
MKVFNFSCRDTEELRRQLADTEFYEKGHRLVQIFGGSGSMRQITAIAAAAGKIENSCVIGCTSAGEVLEGKILEGSVVVSIADFEFSEVKSFFFAGSDMVRAADEITSNIIDEKTKGLIILTDGLKSDGQALIARLAETAPHVQIAGGKAADDYSYTETFVFTDEEFCDCGVVCAALSGDELILNTDYLFSWEPVGEMMTVTSAKGGRVYTINDTPAVEIYRHYLGHEVADGLPDAGIEFPLITFRRGIEVARSPVAKYDDGSVLFAGGLETGNRVRFGFGNLDFADSGAYVKYDAMSEVPVECVFIYTCSGRRFFLKYGMETELRLLSSMGSSAGFFTYGEYFHKNRCNELLNITTTFITLSESKDALKRHKTERKRSSNRSLKALTTLVRTTSSELNFEKELSSVILDNQESIVILRSESDGAVKINRTFFDLFGFADLRDFKGKHRCVSELFISQEGYLEGGCFDDVDIIINEKCKMRDPKGIVRVYKVRASKLNFGEPPYMLVTLNDVTDLENAVNTAVFAEKAKSDFLANISHEIKTPLGGMLGFLDILGQMETAPEKKELISVIRENGAGLLSVINDILDYSKIDNGRMEIRYMPFRLEHELKAVISTFRIKAREKDIELILNKDESLPVYMVSDPLRLKQILCNLISNALKFTPAGGRTELRAEYLESEKKVRFSVTDNGIGIPKENQKRIFRFYVDTDKDISTKSHGGSGLGLAISSSLVDMMGGRLELESDQGEGSRFFFSLDINDFLLPEGYGGTRLASQESPAGAFRGKVLIADDNETTAKLVELILGSYELEYVWAKNGKEAVTAFTADKFNLILIDENMPVMSGCEAVAEIRKLEARQNRERTPIAAFTANIGLFVDENFRKFGMDEFLPKPLDFAELHGLLHKYLDESAGGLETMRQKRAYPTSGMGAGGELITDVIDGLRLKKEDVIILLDNFIEQFKEQYENLEHALAERNYARIGAVAHSIYGAASNLRLKRIAEKAREISECAKNGHDCEYPFLFEYLALQVKYLEAAVVSIK